MKNINSEQFWDGKILKWEGDKYDSSRKGIRRLADVNRSLKTRLQLAEGILRQVAKDRTIIEIGCGTARLLPAILQSGARKYIGIDISKVAIAEARERAKALGADHLTEFHQGDASSLETISSDLCFSLGLLDWLEPADIEQMIRKIRCRYYFHSFSEKRFSLQLLLHRLYVYCLYGHRTGSYRPRYYTADQMTEIFRSCYGGLPNHFRSRNLSFGGFIFQLPGEITLPYK